MPIAPTRSVLLLLLMTLTLIGDAAPTSAQLVDPTAAKAAATCQQAIAKSGAAFVAATVKSLGACFDGVFRCVQTKPDDAKCRAKAVTRCAAEREGARAKRIAKLTAGITTKCASLADVESPDGLGYGALTNACAGMGVFPDVAAVADCVREQLECRAERAFSVAMPRALGLATEHAIATRAGSCLLDLGGAGNVADPKAIGKPLDKCQTLAKKAAAGFTAAKLKGLGSCATTIFACIQTKPGDTKCTGKAAAKCATAITGAIPAAAAKVDAKIAAGCGAIFAEAGAANAIHVDALATSCQDVGVGALASAGDWARCVTRRHACAVEGMQPFLAPRFAALLADLGQSATSDFCPGGAAPTPTGTEAQTPSPTVTVTPAAGETGTATATSTATPTATPTPTPTLTGGGSTASPSPSETPNLVFVSSATYATTLGSAAAYDVQCNLLATTAGLNNGTNDAFIAWISDSTSNAVARLGSARGFVRVDGVPVADTVADLVAGKLFHPVLIDENGATPFTNQAPMTGTVPSGTVSGSTCGDWTGSGSATVGLLQAGPQSWTSFSAGSCGNAFRIYCFQKTQTTAVTPAVASGKRIYMTAAAFAPGSGAPDALCETEKPGGTGPVKALLATTTAAASTVLDPMASYLRPDGVVVGTGQAIIDATQGAFTPLVSGIWQFGDGTYFDGVVWTGSTAVTAVPASDTCTDWSATSGNGSTGRSAFTATGFWSNGTQTCDVAFVRLYCVEQ